MKKLLCLLFVFSCLTGCSTTQNDVTTETKTSFGERSKNTKSFQKSKASDLLHTFQAKESGVYYLGFPECPWCQALEPILEAAVKETGENVYNIQTRDNDGNSTLSDSEKTFITTYTKDYLEKNEDGEPTLYYPFVLGIKDGKINKVHIGTVDGHNPNERDMTIKEKTELKNTLKDLIINP